MGQCVRSGRMMERPSSKVVEKFGLKMFSVAFRVARWFVFEPKYPNLGKFWRVLQWKMLVKFINTWSILLSSVIFYGHWIYIVRGNLVYFSLFWFFVRRKIWQPCLRNLECRCNPTRSTLGCSSKSKMPHLSASCALNQHRWQQKTLFLINSTAMDWMLFGASCKYN
jgi:hypothetical protein